MLKKQKIKLILNNTIANELKGSLSNYDFKFKKSKNQFIRKRGEFEQIINLDSVPNPLNYNEETSELQLIYRLSFFIQMPKYELWFKEKIGKETRLNHHFKTMILQSKLSFDEFDENDFYKPTTAQQFKNNIVSALKSQTDNSVMGITDWFLDSELDKISMELNDRSDILKIYDNRAFKFQHIFLLVYGNYNELANKAIKDGHQYYIDEINDRIKKEANSVNDGIEKLDEFIFSVKQTTGIVLDNQFKRQLKIKKNENTNIQISDNLIFKERLRVDVSYFEIKKVVVNTKGETLMCSRKKAFKLSLQGDLLLETEFPQSEYSEEFQINSNTSIGVFDNDQFYVNNFVITEENKFLELTLLKLKKKNQESQVKDIAYWTAQDKYLIAYDKYFLIYDNSGNLESSLNIEQRFQCKIYPEKEWIVCLNKTIDILDFNGNKLLDFKSGGVNIELSSNYEYAISYFLQKKSQLHNFKTGITKALFIAKNTINKVKISPDSKYLVTDCDNTIWSLPELKKTKLQHSILDEKKHVSDIFFMNDGDLFIEIIKVEEYALVWDRQFSFQKLIKLSGKLEYHTNKYLTLLNKNEFILYAQ